MPCQGFMRSEEVIAQRPSPDAGANLFGMEIAIRIDHHCFIEVPIAEAEMGRPEAARHGFLGRHLRGIRPHKNHALRLNPVKAVQPNFFVAACGIPVRIIAGQIAGQHRFHHAGAALEILQHLNDAHIPIGRKPVVAIDLHRVGLAAVLLLDQVARPTDALALHMGDVDQLNPWIVLQTV